MKTMKATRTLSKLALLAPLALSGVVIAPYAAAETILLAQSTLVAGSASTVDSFSAPTAGLVTVNLQSLNWPTPLSALSFSATTDTSLLASWNGGGPNLKSDTMTFTVGPGTYYAHIMATANPTGMDLGLYSMLVTFTPTVPLPASGWMLLTGMLGLAAFARMARRPRPLDLTGTAAA